MRSLFIAGAFAAALVTAAIGPAAAAPLKVLTSFTIFADMARNVAGDKAEIVSITRPGVDIHTFRPTPADIRRGLGAQLVLWNGLNLEIWLERYLENLGGAKLVTLSDGVEPILIAEGDYEGRTNPHAWMSPDAALVYVDNIIAALSEADPDNAESYAANGAAYKAEIEATVAPIRERLASIPDDKRWLVTSEGAFSYLARDFDLKEAWLWAVNSEQQGTPQQVKKVIDLIKAHEIPVIFSESTVSPKPAEQVARETGARYGGVLYVDSLSEEGGPVPTYLDLLRVTSETIAEGLAQSS
ncbi:metal ABC transporter substrate-binding protein [Pseudohoeflea coraliihabitans]|uniref:Metal ABC transporter substrate-binding protein n=1 Tax=Pseudohoeflea coraliihabitans TaxID=2860393 RepID=A0ABS6WNR6_9HYPH|nr:metal ABC transporter substrate-binding protein [Pseudohoeflea sp. DP4N28-3]MBW3097308.1 metal ABC transporter substrate-binding protein [Pseudohoeflea sp. DP4N28-3]